MNEIPDFIEAKKASTDQLQKLKDAVIAMRDLDMQKKQIEENLGQINSTMSTLSRELLPELMTAAGVKSLTLEPMGNLPSYTAKLDTEVRASILKDWDADKRNAAFEWLTAEGAEDLIQCTVTVTFPREGYANAVELRKVLEKEGYDVDFDMSVHHMSLSKWLRERWDARDLPPSLDVINGYIGPIVKLSVKRGK